MPSAMEEQILRAAKEVAVKFIETGRISPGGFPENFRTIYQSIWDAVTPADAEEPGKAEENPSPAKGRGKKKKG